MKKIKSVLLFCTFFLALAAFAVQAGAGHQGKEEHEHSRYRRASNGGPPRWRGVEPPLPGGHPRLALAFLSCGRPAGAAPRLDRACGRTSVLGPALAPGLGHR